MGSRSRLRSRLVPAAVGLGLVLGASAPAHAAPVAADRDGDGVFDDLEAVAQQAPPERELRVIVSLRADASRKRVARIEREVATLDAQSRFGRLDGFAGVVRAGRLRALASHPAVEQVQRDAPVKAFNASAQASFGVSSARAALPSLDGDADGAPGTYSAGDLVAAVIDTGIDASHVDLDGGKVLAFQDFTEATFDEELEAAYDDQGHGTHVAGTIAGDGSGGADGTGVAPRAALVGLKVLDANGSGFSSDVIAAIQWTITHPSYGIDVINLSLGSDGCADGTGLEAAAVDAAVAAGIVVAAAAGNEGPGRCTIGSPGATASALTVGAMADTGARGFFMADFSSRGTTADGRIKPDIVAPGVGVRSARANSGNGYAVLSGTSMATPFAAGVVLLMREQNPALTAPQVKQRLTSTAIDWGRGGDQTKVGSAGADMDHGHGRLDAHAALAAAGAPLGPGPVVPLHRRLSSRLSQAGEFETFTVIADSSATSLAITLTLAHDDVDGNGYTDADAYGNHIVDFDMQLLKDGQVVQSATTPFRQDVLHRPAEAPVAYTLRVESYSGAGGYLLDVSGGTIVPVGATDAPLAITPPVVSGTAAPGETLTATPGTWTADVTATYSWVRCDSGGTACSETGKTGATYPVTAADGGKRLKAIVTVASASGEASADSALTAAAPVVAPSPTSPPSIVGTPVEGTVLRAAGGIWNGTLPMTRTFSWKRCNPTGGACVAVGAGGEYPLTAADIGSTIRVVETAVNAAGEQSAASEPVGQVTGVSAESLPDATPQPAEPPAEAAASPAQEEPAGEAPPATEPEAGPQPPQVAAAPALSGSFRQGRVVAATAGAWSGLQPIALDYSWESCDASGGGCAAITGANNSTYRVAGRDVGRRLRVQVSATNEDGHASAVSEPSPIARPSRPAWLERPRVRGDAAAGGRLVARGGTWWGSRPIEFRVRWLRCDENGARCRRIRGAHRPSYTPGHADEGSRLRLRIAASNAAGRTRVRSAPTAIVRTAGNRRRKPAAKLRLRLARHPGGAVRRVRVSPA